jgi:hypothetical protein
MKAENAEKEYSAKEAEREKKELLKEAFEGIEFTSESAKKAIMAQIGESVSVKNGKLIGFNDLLEDAKKNDASAFVNKEQENLEQGKAKFTDKMNNIGRGIHRKGLADGLAANRQARNKSRHQQADDPGPADLKILQKLHCDGCRCAAGNNAANITNHIVANRAYLFCLPQQLNGLPSTGNLSCCHGVERRLVSRCNGNTDHIKNDADKNDDQQNNERNENTAAVHDLFRDQRDHAGYQDRYKENDKDPADGLISLLFRGTWVRFRHGKIPPNMLKKRRQTG